MGWIDFGRIKEQGVEGSDDNDNLGLAAVGPCLPE